MTGIKARRGLQVGAATVLLASTAILMSGEEAPLAVAHMDFARASNIASGIATHRSKAAATIDVRGSSMGSRANRRIGENLNSATLSDDVAQEALRARVASAPKLELNGLAADAQRVQRAADSDSQLLDSPREVDSSALIQARAASASQTSGAADASESLLVVYGPVVDFQDGSLNVLGQQFEANLVWSAPVDGSASLGRLAYVEASLGESGYVANRVELFNDYSVPGATTVFVHGSLGSADTAIGQASVGDLQLDVTALTSSGYTTPQNEVAVPGIQPLPGGLILGYDHLVADANLVAALATSDVLSISGSSLQSISGSSLQSISGSSLQSISGSSLQSISGSSLL